jgi:uncharacterized protein DUF6151
MSHPLQCKCGTLRGNVSNPRTANHCVCYCKDCQAFAHFLRQADKILDERGGSEVVQILPKNVAITRGIEVLSCMRLTPKGLLRWYAGCCNTPIGNTLATPKLSFVGLVHNCLEHGGQSLDESFGPVRMWGNTKSAKGEPKPKSQGLGTLLWWFLSTPLRARFNGDYKQNPFFRPGTSEPIAAPRVLTSAEHASLMTTVRTEP